MKLNNVDEATRMVETILNLKREKVLTKKEVKEAIKKIPIYEEVITDAKASMRQKKLLKDLL